MLKKMKKIFPHSNAIVFCIISLQSCLIDVPPSPASQKNNPQIAVPPVINFAVDDSISALIEYKDITTHLSSSPVDSLVRPVLRSNYHLGFPDIVKYKDTWYISVRFSEGHLPINFSHVIIFKSIDLKTWVPEQIFTQEGYDLRDPKLFVADNTLYVHFHSTTINPYGDIRNDYISKYSIFSNSWETAQKINKNTNMKSWFWRVSYFDGTFYTGAYQYGEPLKLFNSIDGINFEEIYKFNLKGSLTESTIRYYDKQVYILIRVKDKNTLLGKANENDLTTWVFNELPIKELGGPNFLKYENNFLIGGRSNNKTTLYYYNYSTNKLKELFILPSVQDNGYPGMYIDNDLLYIVYYSGSNTGKYLINLVIINLNEAKLVFN